MNKTPHKYADVIKAWADGHEVQGALSDGRWFDLRLGDAANQSVPPFNNTGYRFRVKPAPIRITFRTFFWTPQTTGKPAICLVIQEEQDREPREKWSGFIRWATDWQTVEVHQ